MKANYMKEFALPTIEKVQEMRKKADAVNLHLCVGIDIARNNATISIYELDEDGKIGSSVFSKYTCWMDKIGNIRSFKKHLEAADAFLDEYPNKTAESLEKCMAYLEEQMKAAKAAYRKAKKGGTK